MILIALLSGRRISATKIATRPLHRAVGIGACIYGLWLLYASGPMPAAVRRTVRA